MAFGVGTAEKLAHGVVGSGTGATGTWGAILMLKQAAGALVPISMAKFSTVVAGVGSFHWAPTPLLQSFAATPVGFPILVGGAVVGGAYALLKR